MKNKKRMFLLGNLIAFTFVCFSTYVFSQNIVYSSNARGTQDIWVMNSDGLNKQNLSLMSHDPNNQYTEIEPKWSPDGSKIAFVSNKSSCSNIWIMDVNGQNDFNLTNKNIQSFDPCWSPDGQKIYFSRDKYYGDIPGCMPCPHLEIYVYDLSIGIETPLTDNSYRDMTPIVSPDGFYVTYAKAERANDCCNQTDIWIMNADGTSQNYFIGETGVYEFPCVWGKFNNKILFAKQYSGNPYEIVYTNFDRTEITRLTYDNYYDVPVSFSPDNKKILFKSDRGGTYDLWIMDIAGNILSQLTNDAAEEFGGDWRINDERVLFDDFDYPSSYQLFGINNEWTGLNRIKITKKYEMYYGNEEGKERVYVTPGGLNRGELELRLYKWMKGKGAKDPKTPVVNTSQYYNGGIYAARVMLDDDPSIYRDKVVETFWIQSPSPEENMDIYAECDFEYYAYDYTSKNHSPAMAYTTWEQAKPKKRRDLWREKISLGNKWIGLMIRVIPGSKVEYFIYDCSDSYPIEIDSYAMEDSRYAPETDSSMQIFFNQWIEEGERINSGYVMRVDWMIHIQDRTDLSFEDVLALVNSFRDSEIQRMDTTIPIIRQ